MEKPILYVDLSLQTDKAIDLAYFLRKIKNDGYSTVALDYELVDPRVNSQIKDYKKVYVEGLKILKRITLVLENSLGLHPLGQQQVPFYCDIMAIKPMTEKIFHSVCVDYDSYDIITFDISNKLPFMLKRNPVYEAIRKGKYFEITYESMFDESTRVVAMTNMVNIIKATGGKNLIVSSHAGEASKHRTPYDVAALLVSLGLDKNKALAAMKYSCFEVIRSGQHRLYLKGAIQYIPASIGIKLNKRIQKHRKNLVALKNELKNVNESYMKVYNN